MITIYLKISQAKTYHEQPQVGQKPCVWVVSYKLFYYKGGFVLFPVTMSFH